MPIPITLDFGPLAAGWTVYFATLSPDETQAWNGSAFVADTHPARTAGAEDLAEDGSDPGSFSGVFSAGITTPGTYWVIGYRQLGGSKDTATDQQVTYPTAVEVTAADLEIPASAGFDFRTATADYYQFWPHRESITLFGPVGTSLLLPWTATSYDTWSLTDCKRRAPTTKEIVQSGGAILTSDLVWLIPEAIRVSLAVAANLRPGYIVRDINSNDWTVLEVQPLGRFGQTWRLVTRNLISYFALTQLATVTRPNITVDTAGKRMPTYASVYTDVRCRLQEQTGAAELVHDGRVAVRRFDLITATRLFLTAEDRVTVGGLTFTVLGWNNPDRLADPMVIQLELIP